MPTQYFSHSRMKQIENKFKDEETKEDQKGYEIITGTSNIILTAPHSVSQLREGSIKASE